MKYEECSTSKSCLLMTQTNLLLLQKKKKYPYVSPSRIIFLMKFETEGCGTKKEKHFEEYISIKERYFYTTLILPPNSEFLISLSHALQTKYSSYSWNICSASTRLGG